jgi:hypothetical protein
MGVHLMTTSRTKKLPRTLASNVLQDVSGLCGEELPRELVDECARGFVEVGRMANMEGWLMTEEAKQMAELFWECLRRQYDGSEPTDDRRHDHFLLWPDRPWEKLNEKTQQWFIRSCEEVRSVLGM